MFYVLVLPTSLFELAGSVKEARALHAVTAKPSRILGGSFRLTKFKCITKERIRFKGKWTKYRNGSGNHNNKTINPLRSELPIIPYLGFVLTL